MKRFHETRNEAFHISLDDGKFFCLAPITKKVFFVDVVYEIPLLDMAGMKEIS